VLGANQQFGKSVYGMWHIPSVGIVLAVHIIRTSKLRNHLASRPRGSDAPILSSVLTMCLRWPPARLV
jgi:hypothetical protein